MLILKKELFTQIVNNCIKEFPNEACGILAGRKGKFDPSTSVGVKDQQSRTVDKIYQMINTDRSSKTFLMDPQQQLKVMKEIRNLGWEMIGIYHSHSQTEAYPSSHDVELAYYPEASYVIVSIKDKNNPDIRSFKIIEGKITEEQVKIE